MSTLSAIFQSSIKFINGTITKVWPTLNLTILVHNEWGGYSLDWWIMSYVLAYTCGLITESVEWSRAQHQRQSLYIACENAECACVQNRPQVDKSIQWQSEFRNARDGHAFLLLHSCCNRTTSRVIPSFYE